MPGVWMLPLSVIILLDFRIVPTMWYFLFFILLYISCHFFKFILQLFDDDMFTFPSFIPGTGKGGGFIQQEKAANQEIDQGSNRKRADNQSSKTVNFNSVNQDPNSLNLLLFYKISCIFLSKFLK